MIQFNIKFLWLILLFIANSTTAQFSIQEGEIFAAPGRESYNKVLLLKNGKTCYVHIADDDGIKIKIYDKDRKLVVTSSVASKYWELKKLSAISINALFEVSEDIVLFMNHKNGEVYRMVIGSTDGKVVSEQIVGKVKGEYTFYGNFCQQGNINIIKDEYSDNYAVITHDSEEDSISDGIYVVHFDAHHNQLSSCFIKTPGKKSRNFLMLDAVVAADKAVYIATAFTGDKQANSNVAIYSCKPGNKVQSEIIAAITDAEKEVTGRLVYEPASHNLVLAVAPLLDIQRLKMIYTYHVYLCYINAETLKPSVVNTITDEKINRFAKSESEPIADFIGEPVDLVLKGDKVMLVKQVLKYTFYTNAKDNIAYISYTRLGDIGLSTFDATGNEIGGCIVPYSSGASREVPLFYSKKILRGTWDNPHKLVGAKYNGEYPYVLISKKANDYIIFNAPSKIIFNPDHTELTEEDKGDGKWSAACNMLHNGNFERKFLISQAGNDGRNKMIMTASADQDGEGQMAAIELIGTGDDRQARLVWVKFE